MFTGHERQIVNQPMSSFQLTTRKTFPSSRSAHRLFCVLAALLCWCGPQWAGAIPIDRSPQRPVFPLNRACGCLEGSSLWTPDPGTASFGRGAWCTAQGGPSCTPAKPGTAPTPPARVGPGGAEQGPAAQGPLWPPPFLSLPASVTARGLRWTRASSPASGHRLSFCLAVARK